MFRSCFGIAAAHLDRPIRSAGGGRNASCCAGERRCTVHLQSGLTILLPQHLIRGAAAGVTASVVQAIVGKTEDLLLLPPSENSHMAPRLMARAASAFGEGLSPAERWTLGTLFHVGYGAAWGVVYAEGKERLGLPPLVAGGALGGLIYLITFPEWGGAVLTNSERRPEIRSTAMTFVAASVTAVFGLTTALAYDRLSRGRR